MILADDLGWGDVRCYDPEHAVVPTPSMDALAAEGMRFTSAYASASLCSPSRYGLLTGRYSWRTPMRSHVVRQYGWPLIAADRLTLPELLARHGYHTTSIGKWHLGWDWPLRQGGGSIERAPPDTFVQERQGEPVFEQPIEAGLTTRGFRYYFGVDLPNLPPYTFIRDDRMVVAPTDWMATCAAIVGESLPDDAGEDSGNILPLLHGQDAPVREDVVVHSYFADVLSIRQGPWKLSLCAGDGVDRRWCSEEGVPQDLPDQEALPRGSPPIQLYHLERDPGETRNLQAEHPEIVGRLMRRMERYIKLGRSTPGTPQQNDAPVAPYRPN